MEMFDVVDAVANLPAGGCTPNLIKGKGQFPHSHLQSTKMSVVEKTRQKNKWIKVSDRVRHVCQRVVTTSLGRHCRKWPPGAAQAVVDAIIYEKCHEDEMIVYTDGSVNPGLRMGWGFTASLRTVSEESNSQKTAVDTLLEERCGALPPPTTSIEAMEARAIKEALKWLDEVGAVRATILTDSLSIVKKIMHGNIHKDWEAFLNIAVQWVYIPAHCGIEGNEKADFLAGAGKIPT